MQISWPVIGENMQWAKRNSTVASINSADVAHSWKWSEANYQIRHGHNRRKLQTQVTKTNTLSATEEYYNM